MSISPELAIGSESKGESEHFLIPLNYFVSIAEIKKVFPETGVSAAFSPAGNSLVFVEYRVSLPGRSRLRPQTMFFIFERYARNMLSF
jgi:hypothetical protein